MIRAIDGAGVGERATIRGGRIRQAVRSKSANAKKNRGIPSATAKDAEGAETMAMSRSSARQVQSILLELSERGSAG